MENVVTGRVIRILPLQSGDSKRKPGEKWHKGGFVIETSEQYPRMICFTVWGEDRINQFNLREGEDVTVKFNVSSREYQGRWYTDVEAYSLEKGVSASSYATSNVAAGGQFQPPMGSDYQSQGSEAPFGTTNYGDVNGGMDDLPF